MGVTINDVAKKAKVSHTTVSWVIHDDPRITDETKKKVMAAIRELDYHPNYMARSLVKGKTDTIAILSSFFSSPFEMEILKGMEKTLDRQLLDYHLNLYTTRDREQDILMQIVNGKRADAVILLNFHPDENVIERYSKAKMPLILLDEKAPGLVSDRLDNEKGAYLAATHLISRGYKKIGMIMEQESSFMDLSQKERLRGFRRAMKEAGLPFDASHILGIDNYYFEEGEELLRQFTKETLPFDALFCAAGDMVAMGVLFEARRQGLKIPEEMGLVGYDDIQASSLVSPSLTTIRQPLQMMGERLLKEALRVLQGKEGEMDIIFEPEIVIRESS